MENHKEFEKLLMKNQRYINTIADSLGADEYSADLIAVGNMAFYECYSTFDETKNVPLIQYAGKYVRFAMLDFLTENGRTIRLPANAQALIKKELYQPLKRFDSITNDDSDTTLAVDLLASPKEDEPDERLTWITSSVNHLPPNDKTIIELFYGLNGNKKHTLQQIGQLNGYTKENTRLHVKRILKKIKTQITRRQNEIS